MSLGFGLGFPRSVSPAGGPTLNFQFAGSTTLDPLITFTRASTGTFFNSAGVLTSAATNAPRLDYNPSTLAAQGLLIEESRTNLLTYSAELDNAAWGRTNVNLAANATASPDGTVNADLLIPNTTNADHSISQLGVATAVSGSPYTFSLFVKAGGYNFVRLSFGGIAGGGFTFFNLTTGVIGTSSGQLGSSITAVGNGWYRCTITRNAGSAASLNADIYVTSADNQFSWAGNGTSGIFIWGAQLEAGAFPTSYIPTTTTALTRAGDVASVNTLSPWYNASAGTLYGEFAVTGFASTGQFPSTAALSDNTSSNRINMASTNTVANLYSYGEVQVGGAPQAGFYGASASTFGVGTVRKSAIAYAANDFAFTTQGLAVQTDTSGTVPTVDRLYLGVGSTGNAQFLNGYLRRVVFYPRRLSNAELVSITS